MKILVITPYYLPDGGPSASLYAMLCRALAGRGHQVTVIAAAPHYPSGRVQPGYRTMRITRRVEDGVNLVRVPVPSLNRSNLFQRLVQFLIYQVLASIVGWREQYDVLLCNNPFLMVGIPFVVLAVMRRRPAVYSVHDVYPDVGIRLGIFRSSWVIQLVTRMERYCLEKAVFVRILSESAAIPMRALGIPDQKIVLIYDWVDTDLVHPMPRDNAFAREHGLVDPFVVLYAGNIGLVQGLENILTVAEKMTAHSDIRFVFVGDGAGRERLETEAARLGLVNTIFLPYQPLSRMPEVWATADVSLVTLQRGVGSSALPSKSFSILASGRPILASVDEGSDIARMVERSQGGICVPSEDVDAITQAIVHLKANPDQRRDLGRSGRLYAERFHSPSSAAERFEELLKRVKNIS